MSWRVGSKIPINVYDDNGNPVCQCQAAEYARVIVKSVNAISSFTGFPSTRDLDHAAMDNAVLAERERVIEVFLDAFERVAETALVTARSAALKPRVTEEEKK
jgi:hypothetical protein